MRIFTAFIISFLVFTASVSAANCNTYGSESFSTTYCDNGNTYTTSRSGSSTYTSGINSETGSSWNSSTSKLGNSTYQSGIDSDGNSWSNSATKVGNSTIYSGYDSDGNYSSKTCYKNSLGKTTCY